MMRAGFRRLSATAAVAVALLGSATARAQAPPDLLIRDVTVTDVVKGAFVEHQDILVDKGLIIQIGPTAPTPPPAQRVIPGANLIALPGFVDTHTHLWQHVARSVAPRSSLQQWAGLVYRSAHYATAEDVGTLTNAAAGEALLGGVTTVADFASINFSQDATAATLAALKANRIDGGVVWWRQAVFLPSALQDRQIAALKAQSGPGLQVLMGFGPMSFMSLSSVYDGVQVGRRNKLRMTEHEMENIQEARDFQKAVGDYLTAYGGRLSQDDVRLLRLVTAKPKLSNANAYVALKRRALQMRNSEVWEQLAPDEQQIVGALASFDPPSPFPLLDNWGAMDGFLSIHSVWPSQADIALLKQRGGAVSHNPESNMYLASGAAPILDYLKADIPVTIGTDGAASNDRISMFDALRAASLLQKVTELSAPATVKLDGWYWLRAATLNGAAALGLADRTGSLEKDKEADIVLVDRTRLGATPFMIDRNGADLLINSVSARDVAYVVANGAVMVDKGQLPDEAQRAKGLQAVAERLWKETVDGGTWKEELVVDAGMGKAGWWRYRSVRAADLVDLKVRNGGAGTVRVVVAFSGTTFGGQSAPTFGPDTLKRYPLDPPLGYRAWKVDLEGGKSLEINRSKGGAEYTLKLPSGSVTRRSVNAEQVLIYVADGVDLQ